MLVQQLGNLHPPRTWEHKFHVPAANTAAVITLAAVTGVRHVVDSIHASYSSAPTGGTFVITSGGTTIMSLDVHAAGVVASPILGGVGEEVVITLGAGGGSAVGRLNALVCRLP